MIPKEEFTDVTLVIEILTHLAYLTYLSLVIIAKEVKIVKEVISSDILPVAMFSNLIR